MKIPSRPFIIRCPKCNSNVDANGANATPDQAALDVGSSPSTAKPRREQSKAAPLFEMDNSASTSAPGSLATEKLIELLSGLVTQPAANGGYNQNSRPSWNPRKSLVCLSEENRESVARCLAENNYQVFVAQDTRQGLERMRADRLDLVILDPKFDPMEQGAVFVTREVSIMRPAQRRRLFFVLVTPTLRTMDAHSAFLNNVNAVVNVADVGELPQLIEHRLREFNELYSDFNNVMRVPAL